MKQHLYFLIGFSLVVMPFKCAYAQRCNESSPDDISGKLTHYLGTGSQTFMGSFNDEQEAKDAVSYDTDDNFHYISYNLFRTGSMNVRHTRNEVFNLTWEDVDFGNSQLRLWTRKRKGEKVYHWLPMTSDLRTALKRWWEKRPIKSTPYVFVCLDTKPYEPYYGKPFKERRHYMEALCKKNGVKHFGFHAIRHLTASILYHKGYDVSVIQSILRYKSPTTNRYLRKLGLKETREALEKGFAGPGVVVPLMKKRVLAG